MKTCNKCGESKPLSEYAKRSDSDTLRPSCKPCRSAQVQAWRKNNRFKAQFGVYRERARAKGYEFELTEDHFKLLDDSVCTYCAETESLGYDRIDSNLGYTLANTTPCCRLCNVMKNNLTREEFIAHVHRIGDHTNEQRNTSDQRQTIQVQDQRD